MKDPVAGGHTPEGRKALALCNLSGESLCPQTLLGEASAGAIDGFDDAVEVALAGGGECGQVPGTARLIGEVEVPNVAVVAL